MLTNGGGWAADFKGFARPVAVWENSETTYPVGYVESDKEGHGLVRAESYGDFVGYLSPEDMRFRQHERWRRHFASHENIEYFDIELITGRRFTGRHLPDADDGDDLGFLCFELKGDSDITVSVLMDHIVSVMVTWPEGAAS